MNLPRKTSLKKTAGEKTNSKRAFPRKVSSLPIGLGLPMAASISEVL
jgi:hypothetical protein